MQEYNYFELLKLAPFPKLPTKDEIETATKKWQEDTFKKVNAAGTPQDQKAELQGMLKALPAKLSAFATDVKEQNNQKNQYRDRQCAKLEIVAIYMKKYSGNILRDATIRRIARQSGLLPDDVSEVFKKAGFELLKSSPTSGVLTDSMDIATFTGNIEQLAKALGRGVGHIPSDIASCQNLYQYLNRILDFEGMEAIGLNDWKAIQAKFNELSVKHATGTEPYNFYRNIESMAKTKIFNSESNRQKYDCFVKLQESGLAVAMESIASLPESVKTDPIFARSWVSNIQRQLRIDEDQSYAVYNQCCRIPPEEALEKEDIQVHTLCVCGHMNIHESLQAAENAICALCGKKLYKPCPSCGKPVRNSAYTCSYCNYYIPGEELFRQAVQACKNAIQRKQTREARKQLNNAKTYQPKTASVVELENQVNELEKGVEMSLAMVDRLILSGKLNEANQEIQKLRVAQPGIDVSVQMRNLQQKKQEIDSRRKELDLKMQQLAGKTARDQVRICMEILSVDESYEPARQQLRSPALAPLPVMNLRVVENHTASFVTVSWDPNPQNTYVTYTVIRTSAPGIPASPQQGIVLAKDLDSTSFQDKNVLPGAIVYYAVFAVRKNVGQWSKAVASNNPAMLRPGCDLFNYTVTDADCVLQWNLPRGCAGVRLERCVGQTGRWEVIQNITFLNTYTDKGLHMNTSYEYRCTSMWNVGNQKVASPISKTITVSLQKKPDPVVLLSVTELQNNSLYTVTWKTANQGQMEIWSIFGAVRLPSGNLIDYDALKRMGQQIWQGNASAHTATFKLPVGKEMQLLAVCIYGSQAVIGKLQFVSTMQAFPVNWNQMKLISDSLSLPVTTSYDLSEVRIFLDVKDLSRNNVLKLTPFLSIKASDIKDGTLIIPNIPQREVQVAVVGIMKDEAVTKPSCCLISNLPLMPVLYSLNWRKGFGFRPQVNGLSVSVSVKERKTPHVYLVYNRANATIPLREDKYLPDKMAILLDIPAGNSSETQGSAREEDVRRLPQGSRVKLILAPDVQNGYKNPSPVDSQKLVKP